MAYTQKLRLLIWFGGFAMCCAGVYTGQYALAFIGSILAFVEVN